MHFFRDDNQNKLIWKTSKSLVKWLDNGEWFCPTEGDRITLKGTVKAHEEYKGEKQTVLTRCKIVA